MKRHHAAFSTIALSILCLTSLNSQGQKPQNQNFSFKAKVPFQFVLGNRTLPAGTYSVQSLLHNRPGDASIEIVSLHAEGGVGQTSVADLQSRQGQERGTRFTFSRYGDQVFLSEIATGNRRLTFPPAERERQLAGRTVEDRIEFSVSSEDETRLASSGDAETHHR